MAFSNLTYLEALAGELGSSGVVHKLCLIAPLNVIEARLRQRAEAEEMPVDRWALKRAAACCKVHRSAAFGHPIDATASTGEIVQHICELTALR